MTRTIVFLLVAMPWLRSGALAEEAAKATAPDEVQVARWVTQLAAEDYDAREAASRSLMGLDNTWLPKLREAIEGSKDAEQRERLKQVLSYLESETAVVAENRVIVRVARRGEKNQPFAVLDGRQNKQREGGDLSFQWEQIKGADLRLKRENLAKAGVGLRIYQPGTYKFALWVSENGRLRRPAYVEVVVEPPAENVAANVAKEPSKEGLREASQPEPKETNENANGHDLRPFNPLGEDAPR